MRLVYDRYGIDIVLEENSVRVITIEEPTAYTSIVRDLWNQINGGVGGFLLSEAEKEIKLSQKAEIIWNPFAVNCNDKKILNKIYQELKERANEQYVEETAAVNSAIVGYLDNLIGSLPYHLKLDVGPDVLSLFKLYGVSVDSEPESLLDGIVDYMRALSQICNVEILFFVGIKNYLTDGEMQLLYEAAFYEKIKLILIEGLGRPLLKHEKNLILDRDLCTIDIV